METDWVFISQTVFTALIGIVSGGVGAYVVHRLTLRAENIQREKDREEAKRIDIKKNLLEGVREFNDPLKRHFHGRFEEHHERKVFRLPLSIRWVIFIVLFSFIVLLISNHMALPDLILSLKGVSPWFFWLVPALLSFYWFNSWLSEH